MKILTIQEEDHIGQMWEKYADEQIERLQRQGCLWRKDFSEKMISCNTINYDEFNLEHNHCWVVKDYTSKEGIWWNSIDYNIRKELYKKYFGANIENGIWIDEIKEIMNVEKI